MINASSSPDHESITEDRSIHLKKCKEIKQDTTSLQRKRKRKADNVGRDYICDKCNIAYFSYPALYTHNRNKHSMIPITSKNKIFKSSLGIRTKFRYKKEDSVKNAKPLINKLIAAYIEVFKEYSKCPQSIFSNNDMEIDDDYIMKKLSNSSTLLRSKKDLSTSKHQIGEVIVLYIITLVKITKDKNMIHIIALFAFLLKEYLELFGWGYHDQLVKFGLKEEIQDKSLSYIYELNCEDIPNLIVDFVNYFLLIDERVSKLQKEIMDICHNFCMWLYTQQVTSYQLIRVS